jgi:UDP-N-acetylmuramoyl-L-alanyl-D-glutamate--2,6-diaminopimelate ligase
LSVSPTPLSDLLRGLHALDVAGSVDRLVTHVTRDSRQVRSDSVFVAVVGASVDGHDFVAETLAGVVVVEREVSVPAGVTCVQVSDTKEALAILAANLNGRPATEIRVLGVTGTNGKTTITTLIEGALLAAGLSAGRIGTTGHSVNGIARPSDFTTPEAPALQALLGEMRDEGVDVMAMEVSSIGLAQRRVDGIPFHLAVFTNLTRDHLDFHRDMKRYARAKSRLFTELLRPAGGAPRALLFGDDPHWESMDPPDDRWLYGSGRHCDIRIDAVEISRTGTRLELHTPRGVGTLQSPLIGRHNAENLAGALGACLALGMDLETSLSALSQVRGVAGRLEVVPSEEVLVVVDYAHSDDALVHAISTMRELVDGEVWVVFGCGGDRDRTKRPIMGLAVQRDADHAIVTSDNPRHESPRAIIDDVLVGMTGGRPPVIEVDRRRAIGRAIAQARPGDGVLIAGKGHEKTQQIGAVKYPFDDRRVAAEALELR